MSAGQRTSPRSALTRANSASAVASPARNAGAATSAIREKMPRRRRIAPPWTLRRKLAYLLDSVYSFSDLPVRLFTTLGVIGLFTSVVLATAVVVAKLNGSIPVPGYTATVLTIVFFASLNLLGLGIVGSYVWRAYENTKSRPLAVVMRDRAFDPKDRR